MSDHQDETAALPEFTKFPELPEEVRRLIWKAACFESRMIELERDGIHEKSLAFPPGNDVAIHDGFRVVPSSRHPTPTLFYVSREARDEARMWYKLVRFNNSSIWFIPLSDIVYFGPKSCLGTMISVLQSGIKIHRVAINDEVHDQWNVTRYHCCDGPLEDPSCLQPFFDGQFHSLIRRLRLLHGLTPIGSTEKVFPGCPSLNEVILFMKEAGPFDQEIRDNDNYIGFSRYTTEKPHYPLVGKARLNMDAYASHQVATTLTPFAKEDVAWKGDKKPTLQLARRIQPLPPNTHFEILAIHFAGAGQHRMVWWKACLQVRGRRCTFFPTAYSGPGDYLFKFIGKREDVDWAIGEVMQEVAKCEAFFKQEIRVVDAGMAVFPASIGKASL